MVFIAPSHKIIGLTLEPVPNSPLSATFASLISLFLAQREGGGVAVGGFYLQASNSAAKLYSLEFFGLCFLYSLQYLTRFLSRQERKFLNELNYTLRDSIKTQKC